MRCAVAIVWLVAGCSARGVVIEVRSLDPNVDTVELLVAPSACQDTSTVSCPRAIGWMFPEVYPPRGSLFALFDDVQQTAQVVDGVAKFQLAATTGNESIARLAFVGTKAGIAVASYVIKDAMIPQGSIENWRVSLEPIDPIPTDLPMPPGPTGTMRLSRGHAWRQPGVGAANHASCAALQSWNGSSWDTEYYTLPDDFDCDGFTNSDPLECNPYWANYNATSQCVTTTGAVPGACMIGKSACTDGRPMNTNRCTQSDPGQCLPDALCQATGCTDPLDFACMQDALAMSSSALTWADCQFPVTSTGDACGTNTGGMLQLALPMNPVGRGCGHQPLFIDPTVPLPLGSLDVVIGGAAIAVMAPSSLPCVVNLDWSTGTLIDPTASTAYLLDIVFGARHLLLPLRIEFGGQCAAGQTWTCELHGPMMSDRVFQCEM